MSQGTVACVRPVVELGDAASADAVRRVERDGV